jgi:hypothetical protein
VLICFQFGFFETFASQAKEDVILVDRPNKVNAVLILDIDGRRLQRMPQDIQ